MSQAKVAFIGTGNMSYAIIGGMINSGFSAAHIIATNRNQSKLDKVANDFGVQTQTDNLIALAQADIIVLSVKPQMMADLCQTFADSGIDLSDKVFVSVAAGITVARLREMLRQDVKLVRCMPNTPSLLGKGVSGLFAAGTNEQENATITEIFSATGIAMWLEKESQINDIIAVTGSSPAYFFLFMEAIEAKAKALGFSADQARQLVQQTAMGAAMMVEDQQIEINELRNNVTSKGGTTAAAIAHLQQQGLENTVSDAMDACIARALQMEQEL